MVNVLVVGATAHLATTIIPALLSSPYISHITLLSRATISSPILLTNPKITQLLWADLSSLPDMTWDALRGIRSIIWLVGGSMSRFKTAELATEANVSLPLGFLEECIRRGLVATPAGLAGEEQEQRFGARSGKGGRYTDPGSKMPLRFVYMSTYNASQDQFARLWGQGAFRRMKGAAEKSLLEVAEEKGQGMLEVYCLRLGAVLDGGQTVGNVLKEGLGGYVSDALVAKKVVELAVGGREGGRGGGVLELNEVLGDSWADINTVS